MYVLIKILKFCTGSSAKSYQCKFAINDILRIKGVDEEEDEEEEDEEELLRKAIALSLED